jgi:hypothetical protein
VIELNKCCTRLLQEAGTCIGDPHTGVVPLEKRYPELILQFSHATADCRLPNAQNGRRAPKTLILPDEKCLNY